MLVLILHRMFHPLINFVGLITGGPVAYQRKRLCAVSKIVTSVLLLLLPTSTLAESQLAVQWKEERLSVVAEKVPLCQILREVAQQTGLQVQGGERLQEKISVHFSDLSLSEGFQRLLAHVNYIIVEKKSPRVSNQPTLALVFGQRTTSVDEEVEPVEELTALEGEQEGNLATLLEIIQKGGTEAKEALHSAAFAPDPNVQTLALETLAERDPQDAFHTMFMAVKAQDPATRLTALQVLSRYDTVAFPALVEALSDENTDVKGYAMQILAQKGSPEALQALSQTLRDPDPALRQFALEIFAQIGDLTSRSYINLALDDEDDTVKKVVADLLGRQ